MMLFSTDRAEPLIDQFGSLRRKLQDSLEGDGSVVIKIDGVRTRITRRTEGRFVALCASSDKDRLSGKGIMDREVDVLLASAPFIDEASRRSEARTRRLIHNLKGLTGKTTHEIFDVVRQDRMVVLNKDAIPLVEAEILEKSEAAARGFIEILKHQSAQKAEFFAFDKLVGGGEALLIESHNVHSVLMNAFYLFFGEFESRKVRATVEKTRQYASFDYDAMHACLYYLVDNAAKYCRKNSALNVTVSSDAVAKVVDIRFDMESLTINEDELEDVFKEGYSGREAIAEEANGSGIGLYQARELARLNGGDLHLLTGRKLDRKYSKNTFTISIGNQ